MIYQNPDDAVRAWWRLAQRGESVRALDPFAIVGRVPARACASCGRTSTKSAPAWIEAPAKRGGFATRCRGCGAGWRFTVETVLKGAIQTGTAPQGAAGDALARLADLDKLLEQMPDPDAWVYGLYLRANDSYARVAYAANEIARAHPEQFVAPARGWTEKRVRTAVARSRRLLEALLAAAGLMARRLRVELLDGFTAEIDGLEPLPEQFQAPRELSSWLAGARISDLEADAATLQPAARRLLVLIRKREPHPGALAGAFYREIHS